MQFVYDLLTLQKKKTKITDKTNPSETPKIRQ